MLEAILWGLVQGLTEFLPVSSSGHLVLVPAFFDLEPPDLATSAVLHLGTLLAVVGYYRQDLLRLARFRRDATARRILLLLAIGTLPALAGILLEEPLDRLQRSTTAVAVALLVTGVVLLGSGLIRVRSGALEEARPRDAVAVGLAQVTALVPGISRSGVTITAGLSRGLRPVEAARFSFLLGVPTIAGAGLVQAWRLAGEGGFRPEMVAALLAAAVSGYAAIAILLRLLARIGLRAFAVYCVGMGLLALTVL